MRMKKLLGVVVAAVVLRSGAASAYEADERQRPDQNWTAEQSHWFHHAGQGTFILPYHWFLALERPTLRLFGTVPLFREEDNLARFGFLPSPTDPRYNPDGLPIGFAKDRVRDPDTGDEVEVVGLTCAACHTSEIQYRGEKILVDGGSAMIDVTAFQRELGLAVGYTAKVPFRFGRFAARVLGDGATAEAEAELRKRFDAVLASGVGEKRVAEARRLYEVPGGFTRTDALGRIGNLVFGLQLDEENLRVADAPVNYPPLWDASWFDWVQYNASIQQPMARNIGEALGVRARIDLKGRDEELYRSTVNVRNLYEMEKLLSGPEPFEGLRAPKWPEDILGEIDRQKAA
ncbi:MAG: hypothetical protein QOD06_3278, partial [Candidatus Binatota bacterium]|nr:hypothetical protein [Candidatus Binatota bacterium]